MKNSNFLIVDGSSMLVRAYFASAFSGRIMRSKSGVYTNGVFGFLNMMLSAVEKMQPTHLFVAWDVSRDTFRRELYPQYKGTRGELPDELHPQFETMKEVLAALGVPQHFDEKYEADDIIGTLAHQAADAGHKVLVLTGDRDAMQLVRSGITVAIMKKGITEMEMYTPASLFESWGLTASQIIDLKGLMGDTSDNIPGVPGIGEKTAKKLLLEYGTVENLIENRHLLKGKMKEKIEEHQEIALLSKKLATIVTDVPMVHSVEDCQLSFKMETAKEKLKELDLNRFVANLERLVQVG
ncbi:5'-3' exonuclease [Tumebacillus avium]|uniref:5'-3' exonuclease n=1 Tax=Tumebacillus avium TaxID=1903704 RepID=UPI0018E03202|nr:5'-3' exonuclease H3TH domain-containing protein [Tumebacillus avium]